MYAKILAKIKPKKAEIDKIRKVEKRVLKAIPKKYFPETMGSVAKGTWTSGKRDLDVFIFFPEKTEIEKLEKEGLEVGKKVFDDLGGKWEIGYAQHPYVRGKIDSVKVDIVPCYKMEEMRIKSAVDRSPFHVKYVLAHMTEEEKSQVLLLKELCRAHGIYSAELKVEGLSGYLCELLILKYHDIDRLAKAASGWAQNTVIEFEEKPARTFEEPFVVIDPVDPSRNVAAALSSENFFKFVKLMKEFSESADKGQFFVPKKIVPLTIEEAERKAKNFLFVTFPKPDVVEDILYPQMRKTLGAIEWALKEEDFEVVKKKEFADKKCILALELKSMELPLYRKIRGPPSHLRQHVWEFTHKYPDAKEEHSRYVVVVSREHRTPKPVLEWFIKEKREGIASHLLENIDKAEVFDASGLKKIYAKDTAEFITSILG